MLLEAVYEGSHAIVPQLNSRRVQGNEDPRPLGVKGDALSAGGFGFKLGKHVGRGGGHGGLLLGSTGSGHLLERTPNGGTNQWQQKNEMLLP